MAKRLGDTNFCELLPHSIASDAGMRNCADALDRALRGSVASVPNLLCLASLARDSGFENPVAMLAPLARLADAAGGLPPLPEAVLDLLAWQLHVDGYENAVDIQAKRRMVQQSLLLHRRKGTPWSVRNALEAAFGCPAALSEWFQYGGRPYFFCAGLDVTDMLWAEDYAGRAYRLIFEYKNVRSWLEYLATRARTPLAEYVAIASRSHTRTRPCLFFAPKAAPGLARYAAASVLAYTETKPCLHFAPPAPMRLNRMPNFCASGFTRSRLAFYSQPPAFMRQQNSTSLALTGMTRSEMAFVKAPAQAGARCCAAVSELASFTDAASPLRGKVF